MHRNQAMIPQLTLAAFWFDHLPKGYAHTFVAWGSHRRSLRPQIMVFCAFTDGEDIIETLGWICPQGLPPTLQNIKPASITPRGWLTFRPAGPKTAPGVELVA
jgi:hypothetical protein